MSETMTISPPIDTAAKRTPTVYFIDDSATMREVIKIALRRENFNVITCADAASALAQFEQTRPDVVITDVIMPDQDGYSVCSRIKEHPELSGVPVVLMSGVVNKTVADKAVAVKADDLIRKPFQPQELIGRVKHLLGTKFPPTAPLARERNGSNVLQNLFGPLPSNTAQMGGAHASGSQPNGSQTRGPQVLSSEGSSTVPAATPQSENAWPRALVEAFTPILPPFSTGPAGTQKSPVTNSSLPSQPPTSGEAAKLRGEIARMELLVKKLQTELQLEREYNLALENQIRALLATN